MSNLKPCPFCCHKAIIESWSSGGMMYMAKCSNPDCCRPETYPRGHDLPEVIAAWNRRAQEGATTCSDTRAAAEQAKGERE